MAGSSLLSLPPELIDEVLGYLSPGSLLHFGLSSTQCHAFLNPGNKSLWRNIFLQVFEDPKPSWQRLSPTARAHNKQREETWDWYDELKARLDARRIILADDVSVAMKRARFEDVVHALLDIGETGVHEHKFFNYSCPHALDRNTEFVKAIFAYPKADAFIHDFAVDGDSALPFDDDAEGPMTRARAARRTVPECASQLHVYHGVTAREQGDERPEAKANARELVYDWTNVDETNEYGPFHSDGTVNWIVVEAIASLMSKSTHTNATNYYICPYDKPQTKYPSNFMDDWAGIAYEQNAWIGTYAFLDYADLAWFNFERLRGTSPSLEGFEEAQGLLSRLCLHPDESLKDDAKLKSKLPICDDLPVVYFSGSSQSLGLMHTHAIGIRGCVSLVPGGREVRWRFVVRYSGLDQWQLEGVQPGGIRTGPIFGIWSGCEHEENGPVGPFSYFMDDDNTDPQGADP